ncbi:MAG: Gfo/Idh/MocA family oxidoreductase [Candidatus Levyibacteriota bacterium]
MSQNRRKSEPKKLRIGVIGLGGAGRAHVRRLNRNPHVGEIFGFDPKRIAGIENVTIVESREELFNRVDAVTVCTPDYLHFDNIVASLEAGKHVLSEKPMVASLAEAKRLGPYIKRYNNLVFGVHHQMRCAPAFLKAHEIIKKGTLGKLFYIEANYWHDMRERFNQFDEWRQKDGQSLIFAHGCHPLDLLMHLTNETPVKGTAYVSKNSFTEYKAPYTSATILLRFPSNIIGKVHVNSSCVYPQVYDLIIMGDKGTYIDGVLYTGDKGFTQVADFFGDSGWFDTEMIITKTKIGFPRKPLSFAINLYMRTLSFATSLYMRTFSKLSLLFMREADFGFRRFPFTVYNHDYACQYVMDNFISTILGKEKIITTYQEAVRVIALCEELEKDGLSNMKK